MYKNILLPVLFDEEHDTAASFRAAKTLADDDAKVTVMHVLEAIPVYATSHVLAEALITAREEVEGRLEETANKLPGSQRVLTSGNAAHEILEYAKTHDVDCIILASHRPGFGDYFIGSTTARVVRHSPSAVHVIR